nr:N-acylneuraminate cytidylyltransferase A-like isoform X2 [Procambarus clarkii]
MSWIQVSKFVSKKNCKHSPKIRNFSIVTKLKAPQSGTCAPLQATAWWAKFSQVKPGLGPGLGSRNTPRTPSSRYQEMSITGLVLARGGSKSIKRKNLVLLNNQPLLLRCLEVVREAGCFNSIWVSTDDEKIAECAVKGGAKVHHRAEYTAADEASSLCAVQEFLQYHPEISIMCIIQCTSPFIQAKYLRKGMEKIQSGYDSVFSVTRRHLLRWSEGEQSYPLNFNPKQRPRRQDWAGEMYENGMFYFCRTNLIREGRLQGGRCGYIEVPLCDSLDIDSPFDIIVAQSWISYCQRENNKQNL